MAYTNPIVDELKGYIDESKEQLIAKTVLGSKTIGMLNLMGGVKGKTALNVLNTDVELQDASTCGWNPTTSNEISRKFVEPLYIGVQAEWCEKNFLGTFAAYKLRTAAGQKNLPFAEDFLADIVDHINDKLEKMVWQGDSENSGATEFDGLLKIAEDASATTIDFASGSSVWSAIKEVYLSVPEEAMKNDLTIFVGAGTYRQFIQELVAANLYHHNANEAAMEYALPGTDTKVVAVNGLNGTEDYDYIFAARTSNLVYVTDMLDDKEKLEFWYSEDDRVFRLDVEFMAGAGIIFDDEVVVGKIAK